MGDVPLVAQALHAGWDGTNVVRGAGLRLAAGEVVAVLGPNGSGKSTLLWALAGLLRRRAGTVHLYGRRVDGLGPERRAALGLRLLPQARRIFPSLTVEENLAAAELALGRHDHRAARAACAAWLERFPALAAKAHLAAAALSGGEQQLVAIGRVVAARPRVLLLDEPSAGLAAPLAAECGQVFHELASGGVAVLLVEQNVALARRLASRVVRMSDGRLVADAGGEPPSGQNLEGSETKSAAQRED